MRYLMIVFAMLLPFTIHADVLKMQGADAKVITSTNVPSRGMTKNNVRKQYGEPTGKKASVGQPPISRWDYPGYSVYFEYNIVLHAVIHKS